MRLMGRLYESEVDPAAAAAAFGFIFIHPFKRKRPDSPLPDSPCFVAQRVHAGGPAFPAAASCRLARNG